MFDGFKYPFQVTAASGRVAVEHDYESYVKGLIRQLLLTRPGERINRPRLGGGVSALLFSPLSEANSAIAQATIHSALTEWLDAIIRTEDVRVEAIPPSTLEVTIVYLIRATNERVFLNLEVTE